MAMVVAVNLPLEMHRLKANPLVKDDLGKVAPQRGPVLCCTEWADNNGKTSNSLVPQNTQFTATYQP